MWDGPGPGPGPGPRRRGGPQFRGDHREDMYGGRDRPMPDFRGRDGMNMGPMGPMGPRHFDMPPIDMRRNDGPPMRGRDMDPRDMGGPGGRDFFRHGEDPDFPFRRQVEITFREKLVNTPSFGGPGRNPDDMGGRNMPPHEPGGRFMDMDRDREEFQFDRPPFHNDGRRGFPMDRMERNDGFRERRDRSPIGMRHNEGFDMDMPPHERRMMDMDRRGRPPFNPRGGFDSDMDFRNRPGPMSDFGRSGRSPQRFGNDSFPPGDRGRPDLPPDDGGPQTTEDLANDDGGESPLTDYRSGEEMTLAEEWKKRSKEKNPFMNVSKGFSGISEPNFPLGFGRDGNVRDPLHFPERDRMPLDYPAKDFNFPRRDHFPSMDLSGSKTPQDYMQPHKDPLGRENESKPWLEDRNLKHRQPPPNQEKTQPPHEMQEPCFKDMSHNQGPARTKMDEDEHEFSSSSVQPRDQDYRDIDYRTASRAFDFIPEEFPTPEKLIKESKPAAPARFTESASQDQDYRGAAFEDVVSNTVSIIGIPKTATMEQILGAFTTDGVPLQGIKIKNVVPGYSYDTAIVEFLNLEDAVHIVESNKGSLKIGSSTASMKFVRPEECDKGVQESDHNIPQQHEPHLSRPSDPPEELKTSVNGSAPLGLAPNNNNNNQWQRSSDLTPEAWQQQVDQQLQQQEAEPREPWSNRNPPQQHLQQSDSTFKDSKTMIIKYVKPTTSVETILKALDPFAYLDERNVRLVKAKTGDKCFCFVDMESHEQVKRLVELLTKLKPLYIDGFRVYVEVAKPLKNQVMMNNPPAGNGSILGNPPLPNVMWPPPPQQQPQPFMPPSQYMPPPPVSAPTEMQGGLMPGASNPPLPLNPSIGQGVGFGETQALNPLYQPAPSHVPAELVAPDPSQPYVYAPEAPDVSNYLYDATSGFYYDPETTLYYDPNSRYFYNSETQEYLYWDAVSKTYIPVPGGQSAEGQTVTMTVEDQAILSNPAADAPLEMKKPPTLPHTPVTAPLMPAPAPTAAPEPVPVTAPPPPLPQEKKEEEDLAKKDKDKDNKDEKPKSRAAVKIMKDMERWAKIQNRQKESVRTPSTLLKGDDDRRQSKSADAGFAVFERKISGSDELFKMPFAPAKKDEKSKRSMGSLGMLASDYGAGSDEEVEDDKEEPKAAKNAQSEKEDKLTDWKKMACLLCRRQFPNKDALIRHQQLSDLHKQNMEIHLKIKRSKKELEALENQEKELTAQVPTRSPEQKRRKPPPPQSLPLPQQQEDWAGSSRETKGQVSERPGLGAEPSPVKKKKKKRKWDYAAYQQAVRKAMFARYKELE